MFHPRGADPTTALPPSFRAHQVTRPLLHVHAGLHGEGSCMRGLRTFPIDSSMIHKHPSFRVNKHPSVRVNKRWGVVCNAHTSRGAQGATLGAQGNSPPGLGTDQRARVSWIPLNPIPATPVPALKNPFAPSRFHTGQSREFPGATGRQLFATFSRKSRTPSLVGTRWKGPVEGATPHPLHVSSPLRRGTKDSAEWGSGALPMRGHPCTLREVAKRKFFVVK